MFNNPLIRFLSRRKNKEEQKFIEKPIRFGEEMMRFARQAVVADLPGEVAEMYSVMKSEFDSEYYFLRYPDIAETQIDPLLHYIEYGANEGRDPTPNFSTRVYLELYPEAKTMGVNAFYHYITFGRAKGYCGLPFKKLGNFCEMVDQDLQSVRESYLAKRLDLRARLDSGELGRMVFLAAELEPLIQHTWKEALEPMLHPLQNDRQLAKPLAMHGLHKSANFKRAKAVVLIRSCQGSEVFRIGGCLASAIAKIVGQDELVVIQTDESDMLIPGFPKDCRHIDFADITSSLDKKSKEIVLVEFLRSLKPSLVFNVDSRLFWDAMLGFGPALAKSFSLYAYLFCNEKNKYGHRTGDAISDVYRNFDLLTAVATDNTILKEELQLRFMIPESRRHKLMVLPSPVTTVPRQVTYHHRSKPPQIFWAGRFDRQHRVDIVYAIAESMPEIEFRLWGEREPENRYWEIKSPPNVRLEGRFRNLETLPLQECDLWLYTSEWDSVPDLLMEVAVGGLPLVGSIVGGTGDILVEGLCERIEQIEDVKSYVRGINNILSDPNEAWRRSEKLRACLIQRHDANAYLVELKKLIALKEVH